tara:strand:- start:375 stop:884 length:510 start_codon:yes stop_codon:yes gene_type:complete
MTAVEAIVVCAVIAVIGNFEHFTWWAVTTYGVFLGAALTGWTAATWVAALVIQAMVITGVVVMSTGQCSMLGEALAHNGVGVYIAGNFFLHYWPSIGILLRSGPPSHPGTQCGAAVFVFLLYASLWQPNHVYGCPISYNAVVVGGVLCGVIVSGLILSHDRVAGDSDSI